MKASNFSNAQKAFKHDGGWPVVEICQKVGPAKQSSMNSSVASKPAAFRWQSIEGHIY